MSVYYCVPSKRSPAEALPVLNAWKERGYIVSVQRDFGDEPIPGVQNYFDTYRGYGAAVNTLARFAIEQGAEWIVTGGDDILPEPKHSAEEIARECIEHFGTNTLLRRLNCDTEFSKGCPKETDATFGVMQPTGDRWGECPDYHKYVPRSNSPACIICGRAKNIDQHLPGAYVDRSASSPWIGREFARRMYGGRGPFCEEYYHMFDDQELQHVAELLGVFWQRRDLTHLHQHWGRPKNGERIGHAHNMPEFLKKANSPENWNRSKEIFERRSAAGFPGHDPIP